MVSSQKTSFFSHKMARWALFIVALFTLWFAGWFFIANSIDRTISKAIQQMPDHGMIVTCTNQHIKGFPFRLGLFCDKSALAHKRDLFHIEAGALRTVAQIYAPDKIIVELDGPLKASHGLIKTSTQTTAQWQQMRLFAHITPSPFTQFWNKGQSPHQSIGFEQLALNFSALEIKSNHFTMKTTKGGIYARPTPQAAHSNSAQQKEKAPPEQAHPLGFKHDLDLAGNLEKLSFHGGETINNTKQNLSQDASQASAHHESSFQLSDFDFLFDVQLKQGYENLIVHKKPLRQILKEGISATIRYGALIVPDTYEGGGEIALAGPLNIDENGLLSGTIHIGMSHSKALKAFAQKQAPHLMPIIATLGQAVKGMGKTHKFGTREIRAITLSIKQGKINLGFIQLGTIAPLF